MRIVGERINTSRSKVNTAVAERDVAYIQTDVQAQLAAGADLIDVNTGSRRDSEEKDLTWLIDVIQDVAPRAHLCLDSPNPHVMKAVIGRVNEVPMLNSTTAEKSRFEEMAPIIQSCECDVIALCIDDRGIPKSTSQIFENAAVLVPKLELLGVNRERIYLDTVLTAVATNQKAALMSFEIIRRINTEFEGVNTICGLSNISFGMPKRSLINRIYLSLAMAAGLSAAICDPLDDHLMETLLAADVLLGKDPWCQKYTAAFRSGRFNT
ncbi:MAG: dihydropteroate synthase [Desulfobacterales bacterium]|jgi:5-methyltetrahydrofolate--homocysteine methyltransferase